jgi:P22 coat protein - gene protein 5
MANTLTALAPTLYSAAKEVANEPFGLIDAINSNFDDKGVAKGDTVSVPVAPTRTASDFTPAATTSSGTDATASTVDVQITKSRKVSWHLTGEQLRSLENGTTNEDWVRQLVSQGMRTLRNEAEDDAWAAAYVGASRATGTAGTTPFASTLGDLTAARKILKDNGAPMADLQMVMDTSAELNMLNLGVIQNQYQAGTAEERRSGNIQRQFGFAIRTSQAIGVHTKGTGTSYQLSAAGAVGDTTINVDTGSGTLLAGDVVTFAGTSDKYVANSTLSGGIFTIGSPGLRAIEADNDAVAIGNSYTANLAFERSAIVGIMRPPLVPTNPTIRQMLVSDQFGMTYLMLEIDQYGQRSWELHLAWGFKVVNGEFIATVLG